MRDLSPDAAFELLRAAGASAPTATELVPVGDAAGRVLRAALASLVDRPPGDDSSLDGYACHVVDAAGASPDSPVRLRLVGRAHAGAPHGGTLRRGEAVYVATGGLVPPGEDQVGVVGVEHSREEGGEVVLTRPAAASAVRARGRDLRAGHAYLGAGVELGPAQVGLAASMGHAEAPVAARLRVAVVSTGDELVPPGETPGPGQSYESNLQAVAVAARRAGCHVVRAVRVGDDPAELATLLDELATGGADLVLTVGGVSAGEREPVRAVLEGGAEVVFRRVSVRPGGPLTFFRRGGLPVLALPGNPVSALVCFHLFGRAYVDAALGRASPSPFRRRLRARLTRDLPPDPKTVFHRAVLSVDERGAEVTPHRDQSSGVSRSLHEAPWLAVAPPEGAAAGEVVEVVSLEDL